MTAVSASVDERVRRRLRIGEWSVDPETNELCRGSEALRIEPKAMDVLMLLVRRVGHVVSREELFAAVWPGTVVGDEALTQSIIKLRRALGDDPRSPAYIETISKRGYRLIASVRQSETATGVTVDAGSPVRGPSSRRPYAAWAGPVAGLLLMQALAGAYWFRSIAPAPDGGDGDARQPAWVTITVLPFEPLGPDREQAYLARGISDNLMTGLSRLSGLRLIRESGATRTGPSTWRQVSRLGQSPARFGDATDQHLSRRYQDRRAALGRAIRAAVRRSLCGPGRDHRQAGRTLARQGQRRRTAAAREAVYPQSGGIRLLPARQGVVSGSTGRGERRGAGVLPQGARTGSKVCARVRKPRDDLCDGLPPAGICERFACARPGIRACRDRPADRSPEVYWALGFVHAQSRRHEQAIKMLQQAIELDPSFADAYSLLGGIHTYVGNPAKSIRLLRTAMRLNPDGGHLYFLLLGRAYLFEGDTEQALINLRAALMRNPVDVETRVYLAAALVAAGDHTAAGWEADEIRSLAPGFSTRRWLETYPMTSASQQERLTRLLAGAGL